MTNLYETALNGMMVGQKASDLDQMYRDRKAAGAHLEAELLLRIGVAMLDLETAERMARNESVGLSKALTRFSANQSVSNAEWLTQYAGGVAKYTTEAQTAYHKIGELWALWKMTQV